MSQYKVYVKNVEVSGKAVLSFVDGIKEFKEKAIKILAEHGINSPESEKWYSQQSWLDAFKEISGRIGSKTLFQIGKKIPEYAEWPNDINDLEDALSSIDVAYHMNHRLDGEVLYDKAVNSMKEGIGHYRMDKLGRKKIRLVCDDPYPCEFDEGIIKAISDKFHPKRAKNLHIVHDESCPCKKYGNESCVYFVTW